MRRVSRRFRGSFCHPRYHIRRLRRVPCARLAKLLRTTAFRRRFALFVTIVLGVIDVFILTLFFGRKATSRSPRLLILKPWTALGFLKIRKLLISQMFFEAFFPRTTWLKEEFSAGLRCCSTFSKKPFSQISAFVSQSFDLSATSQSKECIMSINRDIVEYEFILVWRMTVSKTAPRSEPFLCLAPKWKCKPHQREPWCICTKRLCRKGQAFGSSWGTCQHL